MKWWIDAQSGQVIGFAIEGIGTPSNFLEVEGDDATDRDQVYYNGESVVTRPDRPSAEHYWDNESKSWRKGESIGPPQEPESPDEGEPQPEPYQGPDWRTLEDALHQSSYFYKGYESARFSLHSNRAFTLLLNTVRTGSTLQANASSSEETDTRLTQDLRFSLRDLRDAVGGLAQQTAGDQFAFPDFSDEELLSLEAILGSCGFDVSLVIV